MKGEANGNKWLDLRARLVASPYSERKIYQPKLRRKSQWIDKKAMIA